MSYLPSSKLYQRDPEATAPEPVVEAAKPKREPKAKRAPATVIVEQTVAALPPPPIAPIPIAPIPVAPPPVVQQPVAPPYVPPAPRPPMFGAKEWLVAPAPTLHVEAPPPEYPPDSPVEETVTVSAPAEELPGRKRNIFRNAQKVVLRHIDRAKNGAKNVHVGVPGEPDMLWWAVMVTGSLCMGLMIWGAWSALPRFGNPHNHLRVEASGPRLKGTNDVPVHRIHDTGTIRLQPQQSPLPHPLPQPPIVVPHATVMLPPPPPDHFEARPPQPPQPPVETPLEKLPERQDPVVFVHANLGDSPMIRTWKKIAETSVFLASFTAAANSQLIAQPPQVDYSKQIENLTKAVQTLSDQVSAMKLDEKLGSVKSELNDKISKIKLEGGRDNSNEFLLLATRLDKLEKMIVQMAANPPAAAALPAVAGGGNLDEIKTKLGSIEQAILKLQPPVRSIALAPPTQEPPVAAKAGTSHVIFVNLYNQDLWLWINQKQHRAPAGTTLTLDNIPAGPATVEVRSPEGVFHKSNPTLVANETFTLTAR